MPETRTAKKISLEEKPASSEARQLNLYEKLAKIRANVKLLKKDASGFGYKYVTEENILTRIQDDMDEQNISLIPRVCPGTEECTFRDTTKWGIPKGEKTPREQNVYENIVSGEMTFTWVNNEDPEETIVVPWFFIGQQADASQAYGSALTYASRYFLLRYFNIATSDDPDELLKKRKEEEEKREKKILDDLIAQIGAAIQTAISADEKNKEKIGKIVEDKIGNRDYRKAKNTADAAALLEALTQQL